MLIGHHVSRTLRGHGTLSGKKKAHKHKSFWPVTPPVTGGSPDREAGSKFYVLSSEPKEHKSFCPDTRPGGPVTGATRKCFMCKSFMCLFCSLHKERILAACRTGMCHFLVCHDNVGSQDSLNRFPVSFPQGSEDCCIWFSVGHSLCVSPGKLTKEHIWQTSGVGGPKSALT